MPTFEWGTLTYSPEPVLAPTTTCETVSGGYIENPAGGGGGIGQTTNFSAWNCTNAGCPPGNVTIEGTEYPKEFTVTSEALPWPNLLEDEEGITKIRTESTGVRQSFGCYAHGSHRAAQGSPGYSEQIPIAEATIFLTTNEWKQRPLIEPGRNATVTSKLAFDAKAGALLCACGAAIDKIAGKLKLMAYKESELITTRDP